MASPTIDIIYFLINVCPWAARVGSTVRVRVRVGVKGAIGA